MELPPKDESRKLIAVPELAIAERMLRDAARAFMHLAADTGEFTSSLSAARSHWAWTGDLKEPVNYWLVCESLGIDPELGRERLLSRLDVNMQAIVTGKGAFRCPCCQHTRK